LASDADPAHETTLRHELKAVVQEAARARVLTALRVHPLGVRTLFPPRVVQSLYLDTPFGRALEENLAGVGSRRKLRFRWYGEARDRAAGTLELKAREDALGWKATAAIPAPVELEGARCEDFVRALAAQAGAPWAERLLGLEPVQWIRYRREYLATADRRVRITLDTGLRAWDQRLEPRLQARRATPLPRLLVVELKCAPGDERTARELLAGLPLFVDRCSKFVLASAIGHGPVASWLAE